jgi:hypothetical protein
MASVQSLTRQISNLDLNKQNAKPTHTKQPSQTNVSKLLTKFAAPNLAADASTSTKPVPLGHARTNSTTSKTQPAPSALKKQASAASTISRPPSPSKKGDGTDIGTYDGALDRDEGELVYGEAAEDLALDSSECK